MEAFKLPLDLIMARLAQQVGQAPDRMAKTRDVLLGPLATDIATTPYQVVYQEDRVRLKYYRPAAPLQVNTPLLMVYALINRETMLDLQPGRSVIQNLINSGVEVYLIDWGYPTRKDRFLTIDDHVNGYLNNIVDFIRERHRLPQINLMGICMGGTFSIIYAALHPHKVKNLITTVTPSNFHTDQGLLHVWMRKVEVDALVDTFGNMPGDLLNLGFLLLNPARLMIDKYLGFLENLDNQEFVENFLRMEKWIFDSPDVPGETFRQFIKECYQENLLIQSRMAVGGRQVDLQNLTMPLLNIYGRHDHLVPPEACELLTQRVGSRDTEDFCLDTGHIGIYVSAKCQRELVPRIVRWLAARDADSRPVISRPRAAPKPRRKKPASTSAKPKPSSKG